MACVLAPGQQVNKFRIQIAAGEGHRLFSRRQFLGLYSGQIMGNWCADFA
jgi:hypothetical protein